MDLPPASVIRRSDTHRLIPELYCYPTAAVLGQLADDHAQLEDLIQLDSLTNDRVLGKLGRLPGIGVEELVSGQPFARLINAAFTHSNPLGGRFNGPDRGCWYAGFELKTSQKEVAFHKTVHLAEIGEYVDEVSYVDHLADFSDEFHDLRDAPDFVQCLAPDSYHQSQALAEELLATGSMGVVYPSVRRKGGTCIACFRPAAVRHVRQAHRYQFTWTGKPTPRIVQV
jgi:RES domain